MLVALILSIIVSVVIFIALLPRFIKGDRRYKQLTKERLSYTYDELVTKFEVWDRCVNPFFDKVRLSESDFARTSKKEKMSMLTEL